ncbi:MAG: hypothetical protein AAGA55_09980, partial [Planctomycetota bacterium]
PQPTPRRPLVPAESRRSAKDQVRDARERARQRRIGAQERIAARRGRKPSYDNTPGAGVVFAGLLGLAVLFGLGVVGGALYKQAVENTQPTVAIAAAPEAPQAEWHAAVEQLESVKLSELAHMPELVARLNQELSDIELPDGFAIHTRDGFPFAVKEGGALVLHHDGAARAVGQSHRYRFGHASPDPHLPAIDARLLVVSDLAFPLSEERSESIKSGLALISQQGGRLSGDLIADDGDASIDDVASFRVARGQMPLESNSLPAKTRDWIAESDFDGVLLLSPVPESRDEVRSLLVTERFFTRLDWDGSAKQYVLILAGNGFEP